MCVCVFAYMGVCMYDFYIKTNSVPRLVLGAEANLKLHFSDKGDWTTLGADENKPAGILFLSFEDKNREIGGLRRWTPRTGPRRSVVR